MRTRASSSLSSVSPCYPRLHYPRSNKNHTCHRKNNDSKKKKKTHLCSTHHLILLLFLKNRQSIRSSCRVAVTAVVHVFVAAIAMSSSQQQAEAVASDGGGGGSSPRPVVVRLNRHRLEEDTSSSRKRRILEDLADAVRDELTYWPGIDYHRPLPASKFLPGDDEYEYEGGGNKFGLRKKKAQVPSLVQLIPQAPDTDEVKELSFEIDERTGKKYPRQLNRQQLRQIGRDGTFSVPSLLHPRHTHVWKVARWLQKGRRNIQTSFRKGVGRALYHVVIGVPDRLFKSTRISIRKGVSKVASGCCGAVDCVAGYVEMSPKYTEQEIDQLVRKEENNFVRTRLENEQGAYAGKLDTRIFDDEFQKRVQHVLDSIYTFADQEWAASRDGERMKIKARLGLRGDELSEREQDKLLRRELEKIKHQILSQKLTANVPLERAAGPEYGQHLADRERLGMILAQVEEDLEEAVQQQKEIIRKAIALDHPILSLVDEWLDAQVEERSAAFYQNTRWEAYKKVYAIAEDEGLQYMARVFRDHILVFRKEEEGRVRERLSKERIPSRTFYFRRRIWRPRNWIKQEIRNKDGSIRFVAQKYVEDQVKTDTLGWRFAIMFHESNCRLCNGVHCLFQKLWNGPFGLKSFVLKKPFVSRYKMDSYTGDIVPDTNCLTHTFRSRLGAIRSRVRIIRRDFEAAPDTGLLGKPISRFLNIVSAYFGILVPGTVIVVVGQPLLTAVSACAAIILATTAPVWAPASSLFGYVYSATLFDLHPAYGPHTPMTGRWFPLLAHVGGGIIISGILRISAAVFAGVVVHPCLAVLRGLWEEVRREVRTTCDWIIRNVLLRFARVPGHDSFLAWRIAGPGITAKYCFQIRSDIALLALTARLESEELNLFESLAIKEINEPLKRYTEYFSEFSDFGLTVSSTTSNNRVTTASNLHNLQQQQLRSLDRKVRKRRKRYQELSYIDMGVNECKYLGWIKQSKHDLENTFELGAQLVASFCERLEEQYSADAVKEQIWYRADVVPGFYDLLAKKLLSDIFGKEFLSPLEETDETIVVPVEHESLQGLLNRLISNTYINDDVDLFKDFRI